MIFGVVDPTVFGAIVAALIGGGWVGGIVAWRKAGPEKESIVTQTMVAVNKELREVNKELREELDRRDGAFAVERAHLTAEIAKCRERIAVLENHTDIPHPE